MSNFTIFNPGQLERMIKPFSTNLAKHITPIKYEAITPDIFAFLFRATGVDYVDHYFVSLEFDYIKDIESAVALIEKWHGGSILQFLTSESEPGNTETRVKIDDVYIAVLAEVERPKGEGYWANNVVVANETEIDLTTQHLPAKQRTNVRKALKEIFGKHPTVSVSYFVHEDGSVDYVYN